MLFLQGARDVYAEPELLNPLITLLADRATLMLMPDADHSFHVPARRRFNDAQINDDMINALAGWTWCGSSPVTLLAESRAGLANEWAQPSRKARQSQ